jgi:hypothetical protein
VIGESDLRARIVAVARAVAVDNGWEWFEPVTVELEAKPAQARVWVVRTNATCLGMNIRVRVRESDLVVLDSAFSER